MNANIFTRIIETIFGRKYYVNIVGWRGTDKIQMTSSIWRTRKEALEHRRQVNEDTLSFKVIETVTFRSHQIY